MVVLSPVFTGMTALLALAGSGAVDAAPSKGNHPRGVPQRKYQQPRAAAPKPFKVVQPAWARDAPGSGAGEQRFAARKPRRGYRSGYLKRSEPANQAANCKRDDISNGPSSIPGYVSVYQSGTKQAGTHDTAGNIVVHTIFDLPSANATGANHTNPAAGHKKSKSKKAKNAKELETVQLLDATAANFTLQASQSERTLLYIVPADANEQQGLGEIIQKTVSATNSSDAGDAGLNTVTVNLVVPLLNATATAQNWCATFSTVPPAPLHLEPCTYSPGYAGEKSSQRFQYTPLSGSLLPLFIQEHAGAVAAGSWGKPTGANSTKTHAGTGRQQNQVPDDESDSSNGADIVAFTTSSQGSSFAVSPKKYLDLNFVPAASHPPLPVPGCNNTSTAPVPAPHHSSSSAPHKSSASASGERGSPTGSAAPSASTSYHWHHESKSSHGAKPSGASSSIGSLKPTRHSHYAPTAKPTKTITVTNGKTVTEVEYPSSTAVASSSEHHRASSSHKHKHHSSSVESGSSVLAPWSSLSSEGWESSSTWVPISKPAQPSSTSAAGSASQKPKHSSAPAQSESKKPEHEPSSSSVNKEPQSSAPAPTETKKHEATPSESPVPSSESKVPQSSSPAESSPAEQSSVKPSAAPTAPAQTSQPSAEPPSSTSEAAVSSVEPSASAGSGAPSATPSPAASLSASGARVSSVPAASNASPAAEGGAGSAVSTLWAVPV